MARQVISQKDLLKMQPQAEVPGDETSRTSITKADTFTDRLLKYIPAEIVAVFILVQGLVLKMDPLDPNYKSIFWGVFLIFTILTPLYLWRLQNVKKLTQLVISLVAFVVWIFALGGPFTTLNWYAPIYGEILLPIFTIVIAIVVAEE